MKQAVVVAVGMLAFALASVSEASSVESVLLISEDGVSTNSYATLAEAVSKATDGEKIALTADLVGGGIKIEPDTFPAKGLTIDFGSYTYLFERPGAGPEGKTTCGFHLGKGNKIAFVGNRATVGCTEANKDDTWLRDPFFGGDVRHEGRR